MGDLLRDMLAKRKAGINCGVPSYCTANPLVIEAVLQQAKRFDDTVLIEATANQVNQYGGYTGMTPVDFRDFVYEIAERLSIPTERIVLGGDHLGPLTWMNEPEAQAMDKAVKLVELYVEAGYKKIHLDTSMRLADDPLDQALPDEVIARRGAVLYRACEAVYQSMVKKNPCEPRPVYIIGSEVPIPGGAQAEECISITKPEAVEKTIAVYRKAFANLGLVDAFEQVIGIVVQPGVEFGDDEVNRYNPVKAAALCEKVRQFDGIVMEGHSTDYQNAADLKQMVMDGIAILKVGPALTFALRNGIFALSMIEKVLVSEDKRVNFEGLLEQAMMKQPDNWKNHYHGNETEQAIKRRYSFSDRWRYYFAQPQIQNAIDRLLDNINQVDIPLGLLYQYMPAQYAKVKDGVLKKEAKALLLDCVVEVVESYNYATKYRYMLGDTYVS